MEVLNVKVIESLKEWQNLIGFVLGVFALLGIGIPIGYRLGGIDSKLDLLDRKIENAENNIKPSVEHIRSLVEGRDGLHVVRNDIVYMRSDLARLEKELKERFPTADEFRMRTEQIIAEMQKKFCKN